MSGDLLVLGAGGKMGPSLVRMAQRAADASHRNCRVIAVSRFSDEQVRRQLSDCGVVTLSGDLLDPQFLRTLPDCENVMFMAGFKFGATGSPGAAWATNAYLPGTVMNRFRGSHIVAFSTGNVYGMVDAAGRGSRETDELRPVGEYAMSAVGRERVIDFFSDAHQTPTAIVRLNYAIDLHYEACGVLDQAMQLSVVIESGLLRLAQLDAIRAVRGEGTVWGIHCAALGDRPAEAIAAEVVRRCYLGDRQGRAIHLLDPLAGCVIRVAPPLTMELEDALEYLDAMYDIVAEIS